MAEEEIATGFVMMEPTPNGGHSELYITVASYALILWLFCAQYAIVWWKKAYPSQYHAWSLAGLWILPSSIGIYNHNWRFIGFCFLFTVQAAYVYYLAKRRPMNADDPQFIYRLFLVVHRITLGIATLGCFIFVFTIFILQPTFNDPFTWLMIDAILFIFYGGYFGVLQRDFSQVVNDYLSKVVTSQIVITSRTPGSKMLIKEDSCGLCARELRESSGDAESSAKSSNNNSGVAVVTSERKTVKLKECSHEFHDECIRGWTVLGKRGVCPTCNEKCDLTFLTKSSPWAKGSESWSEFLDLLRMLLVWNPLIFMVAMGFFYIAGLGS